MSTCSSCKFWQREKPDTFGKCKNHRLNEKVALDGMEVFSYEDDQALETTGDFGCIFHEEK